MITREKLIAAVAGELDNRLGRCDSAHVTVGEAVADRLKLNASPLDALGTGLFVRDIDDVPLIVAKRFSHLCVTLIDSHRRQRNRRAAWYEAVRAAGVRLLALDLLPAPATWHSGLVTAIQAAAEYGCLAYVVDPEVEWKNRQGDARSFVRAAREICGEHGLTFGFTSFALPSVHPTYPWSAFLSGCDLAIAQAYDRDHELSPTYATRAVAEYHQQGAKRVLVGRGAFRRSRGADGKLHPRWRQAKEIEQHRRTTPAEGLVGTTWWPLPGPLPIAVLEAIVSG